MITAEDIARLAGVSRSTVSRVVNNYANVPEKTRLKVLRIIEEQGYVPHASARLLAGSANRVIGLYIDNRSNYYTNKISSSSFFAPFTTAVIDHANKLGYNVLVTQHLDNSSFIRFRELLYSQAISAGIILGGKNNDPRILALAEQGFLLGVVDHIAKGKKSPLAQSIVANFDNFNGARIAVRRLYELGHRRIGHISGNRHIYSGIQRLQGFLRACSDLGLNDSENLIADGDFSEAGGAKAAAMLLGRNDPPTAIFAANDESALGVLKAAEELKVRIPKDLSLIGFDDIEIARYVRPGLSTISGDKLEMAALVTENLIAAIEKKRTVNRIIEVPVTLVERGSCRALENGTDTIL